MKTPAKFRDYLEDRFAEQYDGLDDEMPDAEGEWFTELDPEDVIAWAEKWHGDRVHDLLLDVIQGEYGRDKTC